MKFKNNNLRDIKTTNPHQESHISCADEAGHASSESGFASGKSHGFFRPMWILTGVALCMGLSSCVVPYDSYGGDSATVTTYRPGYRVNSLPGGYRSETISGSTYYYHDGYYYRQGSGGYVVVDAPRSSRYYDDYGRRHRSQQPSRDFRQSSNRHDQQYEGNEVITRLPNGYREVNHRGEKYYQSGDRYYRRQGESYIIVSSPY
ncbi:MAG: hypothetical protein Q8Q59_01180 [Luteolibacter sp.]|nr:hypothetical protein [Luteolibacter sp.]